MRGTGALVAAAFGSTRIVGGVSARLVAVFFGGCGQSVSRLSLL
jgi:hypothetical protein